MEPEKTKEMLQSCSQSRKSWPGVNENEDESVSGQRGLYIPCLDISKILLLATTVLVVKASGIISSLV